MPGFPSGIRLFALTHSRVMLLNASLGLSLWLMIFPGHSPFGLPVHVAASQLAPFSLGVMFNHRNLRYCDLR